MIRAAILCRVSSEGQRDNTSLPEQERILTDLCQRNGWAFEVFREVESGGAGLANRPVLSQILGRVAAGEFQRVCVLMQDRLTRAQLGEIEQIGNTLAKVGAKLVTPSGEFDPSDPDQGFMLDINAVLAKREREVIRQRVIRGKEVIAKEGRFTGHVIPYGWRKVFAEDGSTTIVVVPEQAAAVRRAFDLYATGLHSFYQVAETLNAEGHSFSDGTPWHHHRARLLLTNSRYAGLEEWRRERNKRLHKVSLPGFVVPSAAFPPIIPVELWERARQVYEQRRSPVTRKRGASWPLSGILRCRGCGGTMRQDDQGDGRRYYSCLARCAKPQRWRADLAHEAVTARLGDLLRELEAAEPPAEPTAGDRSGELHARLAALDAAEWDLWQAKQAGKVTDDAFYRLSQRQAQERRAIEAELAAVTKPTATRPMLADVAGLVEMMASADDWADLRQLFTLALQAVTLVRTSGKIRSGRHWLNKPRLASAITVDERHWGR